MLALQIDNPIVEKSLKSEFSTTEEITKYLYDLVIEDLEDKRLLSVIQKDNKKDFVSRDEVFDVLDHI